jgi:hypothetical protein
MPLLVGEAPVDSQVEAGERCAMRTSDATVIGNNRFRSFYSPRIPVARVSRF